MLSALVSVLCLDIGRIFPTDMGSPNAQLARASRIGDFAAVRRCFLDYDSNTLDLDTALCAAAAHSHMGIVGFLVTFGASDLEHALLCDFKIYLKRGHQQVHGLQSELHSPAAGCRRAHA